MAKFKCCGMDDQGEHADDCPDHFNRKTWLEATQRSVDIIVRNIAEAIDYETRRYANSED